MDKLNLKDIVSVAGGTTGGMILTLPVKIKIVDGRIAESELYGDHHFWSDDNGYLCYVRRNPEDREKTPNWPDREPD